MSSNPIGNRNFIISSSPPWHAPFPNCEWFDLVKDVIINNSSATLIDFTLPIGSEGVVKWFGQDLSPASWNDVTWKLRINGGPDKVYGNIIGQVAQLIIPTEVFIMLPDKANITLEVSTTLIANITAIGRLKGWYWPKYL